MKVSYASSWLLLVAAASAALADTGAPPDPFDDYIRGTLPLSPEAERASLVVPAGFEVQLFAAEPDIAKPLNMAFDARGRLWVTTTVEYPYPAPPDRPGRDAIKILEDSDGDGRADRITTFADDLNIPIGILPHGDGVIVWSIPHIFYLRDRDGDGRADERHRLYGPLGWQDDAHGMINSLRRGPDGWIYVAHGYRNTSIIEGRDGSRLRLQSGNVFRVRADGSRVEPHTFGQVNPFGMAFDVHGNLLAADCHSRPFYQLLAGAHYPSFEKPHDGLGFAPALMEHMHGSTGIAGLAVLGDESWPEEYRDNVVIGNVITSRVNRDRLELVGSSPRAIEEPDFVVSRDPWFRPVDLQLGPDGALYVADFYNRIIGHYEVPLDHPGRDRHRGRIFRIVPPGSAARPASAFDLTRRPLGERMAELGAGNATRRLLALHDLADEGGPAIVGAARASLRAATPGASGAHTRAASLWLLNRLGALDRASVLAAARDAGALVRETLMRVLAALPRWRALESQLARAALADRDPHVVRAAVQALGARGGDGLDPLLTELERRDDGDSHRRHAAKLAARDRLRASGRLTSLALDIATIPEPRARLLASLAVSIPGAHASRFLLRHLERSDEPPRRLERYLLHVARYAAPADLDDLAAFAQRRFADDPDVQLALLQTIERGATRAGRAPSETLRGWAHVLAMWVLDGTSANALAHAPDDDDDEAARHPTSRAQAMAGLVGTMGFADLLPRVRALAFAPKVEVETRATLLTAVAGLDPEPRTLALARLLSDRGLPSALRVALGEALSGDPRPLGDVVRGALAGSDRPGREALAEALASHRDGAAVLLDLLEQGALDVELSMNATIGERLRLAAPDLEARLDAVRARAAREAPTISQVIAARQLAFDPARADAEKGKDIFKRNCAVCHRLGVSGGLVGPQLDGVGGRGVARLLEDILDPNRNIDGHFRMSYFSLRDGGLVAGLFRREEGETLIVADATGQEIAVRKADVLGKVESDSSLMPDNFADLLSEQALFDLLAFLLAKSP